MKAWESKRKDYLHTTYITNEELQRNLFPVEEMSHDYEARELAIQQDLIFKNQDSHKTGPGFSKEFYNELHRFYSQGNRRSGRTYLLARVLVNTAIETDKPINFVDHHSIFKNSRHTDGLFEMAREIEGIICEYEAKGLSLSFNMSRNDKFTVRLKGNILEAMRVYNKIKNDYTPYNARSMTPDETFETNRKLLLLL